MENIERGGVRAEEPSAAAEGARAEGPAADARHAAGERARGRGLAAVFNSRAALYVAGAVLVGAVFWYLQFSTASVCCGDFDAYYHFRWSRMLWDRISAGDFRNFPPVFGALPMTTLNPKDYVDHHLLFHVLQIPFTWFSDMQTGAKVGTWLFACLAVLSCYWLVVRNRLSYPLVWLVAIVGSSAPFLYRMNMGKAMSVSIVLLVAGIHLLFERKYRWLFPLAFFFALTYDMFALLVIATVMWSAVMLWTERRVEWKPLVFVAAGSLLGFVINPYFPHNFQLLYEHLLIKVTAKDFTTTVGSEWYPYSTWEFLGNCGVALVAMVAGYVAFRDSETKAGQRTLLLLLFSTLLMVVNMRWRRFAEYFPPFAVLFAAFALDPLIRRARERYTSRAPLTAEAAEAGDAYEAEAERTPARAENARAWELILVGTAFVLLAAPLVWYARVTSQDIAGMAKPDYYRGGAEWMNKNLDKGELVLNTDWDDFPKLFFYSPDLAYVSGLDPTYLLDKDQKLAELYGKITIARDLNKEEIETLGATIREKFCAGEGAQRRCARYVFTDREHEDFYNHALDSGWFDLAYEDEDCAVFRVREQKGEPVPDNLPAGSDADQNDTDADTDADDAPDDGADNDNENTQRD
ncbi:MAG TPA: hypothetical protein VM914_00305 [Pyrinomonadaceae bacterium]|jgi:hypothetical protein|nr:hypothetical protein [Pyrinomonadaceae bacterium]